MTLLFLILLVPSVLFADSLSVAEQLGQWALERELAEFGAPLADEKTCFLGLDSIEVVVSIDKDIEKTISTQRAKDKFELVLRKHGVPLSDSSYPYLLLSLDGFWTSEQWLLIYDISLSLRGEQVIFYRKDEPYRRYIALWEVRVFGIARRKVARERLLATIEEKAERVANLYLSANPQR